MTSKVTPEIPGQDMTLFKFPCSIIAAGIALGTILDDINADWSGDKVAITHYSNKGAMSIDVAHCIVILLLAFVPITMIVNKSVRITDAMSVFILAIVYWIHVAQIIPRIAATHKYDVSGTPSDVGRIPSQLRGLQVFNLTYIPLLILYATLQLYAYVVVVSSTDPTLPIPQEGSNKKED